MSIFDWLFGRSTIAVSQNFWTQAQNDQSLYSLELAQQAQQAQYMAAQRQPPGYDEIIRVWLGYHNPVREEYKWDGKIWYPLDLKSKQWDGVIWYPLGQK